MLQKIENFKLNRCARSDFVAVNIATSSPQALQRVRASWVLQKIFKYLIKCQGDLLFIVACFLDNVSNFAKSCPMLGNKLMKMRKQ